MAVPGVVVSVVVGAASAGSATWVWQDNVYRTLLADQAADYGKQLADKDRVHAREREEAAAAALDQMAVQQAARRDLEARLQERDKLHWKDMNDAQQAQARLRDRLATADLRLSVLLEAGASPATGCGSGGERPPAPEAWWLEPYAPNLTQRMLEELSPSPTKEIED